ncbi:MAG: hypothetical protein AAFP90_06695 [Planctomycetota bacterium]
MSEKVIFEHSVSTSSRGRDGGQFVFGLAIITAGLYAAYQGWFSDLFVWFRVRSAADSDGFAMTSMVPLLIDVICWVGLVGISVAGFLRTAIEELMRSQNWRNNAIYRWASRDREHGKVLTVLQQMLQRIEALEVKTSGLDPPPDAMTPEERVEYLEKKLAALESGSQATGESAK